MLFRPLTDPLPPALHKPGLDSLAALEGLNGYDQLEFTCRHLAGILQVYRATFAGSRERRDEFDVLCDALRPGVTGGLEPVRP